ncbi:adenosine receptor A3 isoform X3 [Petaurus breviceps papuanus]|uniref:adenosine receptor A3 isoform X3 n=1 Tax=Petaurus breviceps papuanus TaxID=3040969 RepID=UPI0036DBAAC6
MLGNNTTLTPGSIVYITVEIVIGLCAIIGNVLVIWVVKLNPGLQNTTFYFIVSLALADIAVGVLVMPLAIVISLGITTHFYNCLFMTCLLLVFTHASIMSLLAIAVDRYLRVKLTIRSTEVLSKCPFEEATQASHFFYPFLDLSMALSQIRPSTEAWGTLKIVLPARPPSRPLLFEMQLFLMLFSALFTGKVLIRHGDHSLGSSAMVPMPQMTL